MPGKGALAPLNHEMTNDTPHALVDFMDMSFGSSAIWELYIKRYTVADAIKVELDFFKCGNFQHCGQLLKTPFLFFRELDEQLSLPSHFRLCTLCTVIL